jgi:glycosyltransferase involved in cell wall biosynthesis
MSPAGRQPVVSVVIPCYKYGSYLADCTASVLTNQPGVDVRVLIIDDASPDDSAVQAKQIAAADDRVQVLIHPVNAGHLATYNEGLLQWADGDYAVLLSADDRLTPGALSRACALLEAHPEIGFAYGHPVHFMHPGPPPLARTAVRGWTTWPGRWWLEQRFRAANGCITSPEVVMRTSVLREVGGFDLRLPHTGDIELWMRLAAHADVGYVRGTDQAYYRVHGKNMSNSRDTLTNLQQRRMAYEVFLEHCGDLLPAPDRLSSMVHRRLAAEALVTAGRAYDRRRTDRVPVSELVGFAQECWPSAAGLGAYRSLRLRQAIGPALMPFLQPLVLTAAARKARSWWWWRRWERQGI